MRIASRGVNVIDIGANIGWYSCLMHRATKGRGVIVAVEPMPRALRLLRRTADSRPPIQVVPGAIGEATGYAQLCEAKLLDLSQVRYSRAGQVEVVLSMIWLHGLAIQISSRLTLKEPS